jgi:hypothetical protein
MVPAVGKPVAATHAPDAGCPSGASFAIGSTDGSGQLVFAIPSGTWQVTVDGGAAFSGSIALDPTLPPADADGTWPYDIEATAP